MSLSLEGNGALKVSWDPLSSWPRTGPLRRGGAHHWPYPAFFVVLGHTRWDASTIVEPSVNKLSNFIYNFFLTETNSFSVQN